MRKQMSVLCVIALVAGHAAEGKAGARADARGPLRVVVVADGLDVHKVIAEVEAAQAGVKAAYPCVAVHGFAAYAGQRAARWLVSLPGVVKVAPNRGRLGQMCAGE